MMYIKLYVLHEQKISKNSKSSKSIFVRIAPSDVMDEGPNHKSDDKTGLNTTHVSNVRVLDQHLSAEVF